MTISGTASATRGQDAPASEPSSQLMTAASRSPELKIISDTPADSSDETA